MVIINRAEAAEASPVAQHLTTTVFRALETNDMQGDQSWSTTQLLTTLNAV